MAQNPAALAAAQRLFNERSLPIQVAFASLVAGAIVVVAAWYGLADGARLALGAGAGAFAAGAIASAVSRRTAVAVRGIAATAVLLRRHADEVQRDFALAESSAELRQATLGLRRLVEAARKQIQLLEERNAILTRRLQDRTHELSTLQDLSIGLATKTEIHELVNEALGALEQTLEYSSASMWARSERRESGRSGGPVVLLGYRVGDDGPPEDATDLTGMRLSRSNLQRYEQIEREREPIVENNARQSFLSWLWEKVTDDARSSALYRASRSWMAVPLKFRDDVLGVMRVDHQEPDYFDVERSRLLSAVGSQTALAIRHAQLLSQEREVAVIAERNRIARDLHDAVSQTLFAANVMAGTLAATADREPPPAPASIATQARALEQLNRGALAEMRLLMFELRPDALQNLPLAELLHKVIDALSCQGVITVEQSLAVDDDFAAPLRVSLYRIAQEALSNAARHSGAIQVQVEWRVEPGRAAVLRIADNGAGFDPGLPAPGHFGLESMRSRAQEIGAMFTLTSTPGSGTEVRVQLECPGNAG